MIANAKPIDALNTSLDQLRSGLYEHWYRLQDSSSGILPGGIGRSVFEQCLAYIGVNPKSARGEAYLFLAGSVGESPFFEKLDAPQYHNHIHACEAMVCSAFLLKEEYRDNPEKLQTLGPRLILAMMVHDLDHQGLPPRFHKEAEHHSAGLAVELMENAIIELDDPLKTSSLSATSQSILKKKEFQISVFSDIDCIVEGTEFQTEAARSHLLYRRHVLDNMPIPSASGAVEPDGITSDGGIAGPESRRVDMIRLNTLAAEADVLASSLPGGVLLGQQLAKEMRLPSICSFEGRLVFLKSMAIFSSHASHSLGVHEQVQSQIWTIEMRGCKALDAELYEQGSGRLVKNSFGELLPGRDTPGIFSSQIKGSCRAPGTLFQHEESSVSQPGHSTHSSARRPV